MGKTLFQSGYNHVYLLHTSIVSELRSRQPHRGVMDWFSGIAPEEVYLSAVTVGEIQSGIEITREQHADLAEELDDWLRNVLESQNVLPLDATVFRTWARLLHRRWDIRPVEVMIAATAVVHRLIVVTGNPEVYSLFNVKTLNPYERKQHHV